MWPATCSLSGVNPDPPLTEKTLTEEKTVRIGAAIDKKNTPVVAPAIPAPADPSAAAPIVLSQAPPISPSAAKPAKDKATTIIAPTPGKNP